MANSKNSQILNIHDDSSWYPYFPIVVLLINIWHYVRQNPSLLALSAFMTLYSSTLYSTFATLRELFSSLLFSFFSHFHSSIDVLSNGLLFLGSQPLSNKAGDGAAVSLVSAYHVLLDPSCHIGDLGEVISD